MLELIGLDEYTERVYRTVLAHQGITAGDAASLTGSDVGTAGAALGVLEDKRLVRTAGEGYVAVAPDLGVEALVLGEQLALLQRQQELHELRGRLAELAVDHRLGLQRADGFADVEVICGDAARERLAESARTAGSELVAVHRTPFSAFAERDESDNATMLSDVDFRVIYAPEWLALPGAMDRARSYVSLGRQVRTLPSPPMTATVVDRRVALVPRDVVDHGADGLLVIRSAPVVAALHAMFEVLWARAVPLTFERPSGDDAVGELPPELAALVPLLAAGLQDQAIARQLGIGLRTVRRRMQALMEMTGARTRLQAGIRLARRGWV